MRVRLASVLAGLIALAFVLAGGIAGAETINCTPITGPITITSPGVYCLTGDLDVTPQGPQAQAIYIDADNVIVDFKGHVLKGDLLAGDGAIFVFAHRNVTIRNGTVIGLGLSEDGRNTVIEDLRFYDTLVAIHSYGDGAIIRRNFIVNSHVTGIVVVGNHSYIFDNDIVPCRSNCARLSSPGIDVTGQHHFIVNNRVTNRVATNTCGISIAPSAESKFRDNIVDGAATAYCGGTDVGNNN